MRITSLIIIIIIIIKYFFLVSTAHGGEPSTGTPGDETSALKSGLVNDQGKPTTTQPSVSAARNEQVYMTAL